MKRVLAKFGGSKIAKKRRKTAKKSRKFREMFAIIFYAFARLFEVFRVARSYSDALGCVRMHLDAFGHFRKLSNFFDEKIVFSTFSFVF